MAYFSRLGPGTLRPTGHVSGAWDESMQHIGPALGLLAHAVERDCAARRDDPMVVARLTYELLGVVPMDEDDVQVEVVRPGRTTDLGRATSGHAGRTGTRLRAWLQTPGATGSRAAVGFVPLPPPAGREPWDPPPGWPGGFLASAQVRLDSAGPGRSRYWV